MKILNQIRLILVISIALVFSFINTNAASYFFSYSGHTYEIVDQKKTWTDAATYATGKGGYLVHIESSGEQSAIWSAITTGAQIPTTYTVINDGGGIAYIWIGATDKSTEGTWLWDGDNDNTGTNFWKGQGAAGDGDGAAINGAYNNWGGASGGTINEPDDFGSNQDGAGIALEPWPKNMGFLGSSGEWNDLSTANQAYFIIEYDYPGKPGKATIPTGNTEMCQDAANTQYTSTGADNAVSYNWYISPSNAGVITGGTTTGTVDWNKDFNGTAQIYLVGINPVGVGDTSNKLSVVISPKPAKCDKPYGDFYLCLNPANTSYIINGVSGAESYKWVLNPANAGTISGNGKEVDVDWSDTYIGEVKIIVAGVNNCGTGDFSDNLTVFINTKPNIPNPPKGLVELSANPENTIYSVTPVNKALSYEWKLDPDWAATITVVKDTSISLDWDSQFKGEAKLSVAAKNDCGTSEYSQSLTITVAANAGSPSKPTGETDLCQGYKDTEYITEGIKDANNYKWVIVPNTAGVIAGATKSAYVKWNKDFYGTAKIAVAAITNDGVGVFSDSLKIDVNPNPIKPNNPAGDFKLCVGSEETEYNVTVNEVNDSYVWSLSNEEAGELVQNENKVIIKWNKSFYGEVKLEVAAENKCGKTEKSSLTIQIDNIPDKPATPKGADSLDIKSSQNSSYTIEKSNGAESYKWELSPTNAGQLTPNSTECEVKWNSEFKGNAQLKVKAINKCGETEFSNSKEIVVYQSNNTDVKEMNSSISIYPNPATNFVQIDNYSKFDFNNIKIYDFKGQLKLNQDVEDSRNLSINVSELNSGAYIIILSNNYEVQYFKIVKE